VKLDIGCGKSPKSDFTGIDAYVKGKGIVNAEMWSLPFGDGQVEQIYSSHALEHVSKKQVVPTLKEWYRVLKPGGVADIRVPDLEYCCETWLEKQTNDFYMDILFGNQNHEGEFHKTGFTISIMTKYLHEAGFTNIHASSIWSHEQNTLVFLVVK